MTILDKPLARECPEIVNDEGRELQATLTTEDGGTLALKWKGLRASASLELGLGMLMRFAEKKASGAASETPKPSGSPSPPRSGKGVDKTEWVRYDDILSRLHIFPDLSPEERKKMVDTVKDMQDLQNKLSKS